MGKAALESSHGDDYQPLAAVGLGGGGRLSEETQVRVPLKLKYPRIFFFKFTPNLLNGRISEVRNRPKQILVRRS